MANRVDSMSEAELRTKLAEHGFPVMPITATTKKVLVKKLKLILANKNGDARGSSSADTRRSLAKYSSAEDADTNRQRRGRRTTTGGAMPLQLAACLPTPKKNSSVKKVIKEDLGSESDEQKRGPIKTHEEVETVTTRRVTRLYTKTDQYETESDRYVDTEKKSSPFRSNSRSTDCISSTRAPDSPRVGPPKSSICQRLGLNFDLTDRTSLSPTRPTDVFTSCYKSSTGTDEAESPYFCNYAQGLSTLAPKTTRAAPVERNEDGGSTYVRKPSSNKPKKRKRKPTSCSNFTERAQTDCSAAGEKFLPSNIFYLALVAAALSFLFLFSNYLITKDDMVAIVDYENAIIPICQLNILGDRPGINCIPEELVSDAKSLLSRIRPELSKRVVAFKCTERGAAPFLTEKEIFELCVANPVIKDEEQIRNDLYNLHVLLLNNPEWGVSVVEMKRAYDPNTKHKSLKRTDDLPLYRSNGNLGLMLTDPSSPISCLLGDAMYSCGSIIVLLVAILTGGCFAHCGWKMYFAYNKRKKEKIYSMVEHIIQVISNECEDNGKLYISVNHVRDMLVAPQDRIRITSAWESAIAFIKKYESRVRMEVQSVDGEDCEVWRWISPRMISPRVGANAWHVQAFKNQEGSVNNLSMSPFLKILHMFDKSDNRVELSSVVQDAILEKVGHQCNILHIDLDRAACCVYVKCSSLKDASVVYKSIHGWWYKGKLITVKYLR